MKANSLYRRKRPDAPILIQNMFRITPKPFNAINVMLRLSAYQSFRMIHRLMVVIAF